MNEEIEYAEMLEIPVSTVNVVRKKRRAKRKSEPAPAVAPLTAEPIARETAPDLKGAVIAQVNDKLLDQTDEKITAEAGLFAEGANSEGAVDFNGDIPERIDTVRVYATGEEPDFANELHAQDYTFTADDYENVGGRYALKGEKRPSKGVRILLGVEFAAACALCGAIFLTNVFMPNSAINTFFRAISGNTASEADARTYNEFTLSGVVNDFSEVEMNLSPAGILSFQGECCVYPAADGKVSEVVLEENGTYTLKISHSDSFTGVMGGLQQVYYAVGDEVKSNVPVGFADGNTEVQVTMYSEGELLNCFQLTEENCLAWVQQE